MGNFAHSLQNWLPFAQMPHHHDWHHEGHKGCNYTFTSMGGFWDCIFGTRKTGRHDMASTRRQTDVWKRCRSEWQTWTTNGPTIPLLNSCSRNRSPGISKVHNFWNVD